MSLDALQCVVYQPDPDIYGTGPYPTVLYVYGGPHVQIVSNRWRITGDVRLVSLLIIIIVVIIISSTIISSSSSSSSSNFSSYISCLSYMI